MANLSKLKGLRAEFGLNQEEVAKKLGISVNSFWNKENGVTEFTLSEAKKLCELFGVDDPEAQVKLFFA